MCFQCTQVYFAVCTIHPTWSWTTGPLPGLFHETAYTQREPRFSLSWWAFHRVSTELDSGEISGWAQSLARNSHPLTRRPRLTVLSLACSCSVPVSLLIQYCDRPQEMKDLNKATTKKEINKKHLSHMYTFRSRESPRDILACSTGVDPVQDTSLGLRPGSTSHRNPFPALRTLYGILGRALPV